MLPHHFRDHEHCTAEVTNEICDAGLAGINGLESLSSLFNK